MSTASGPVPGEDEPWDETDDALLADLARIFDAADPVPVHLAELIAFGLELDTLEQDVALVQDRAGSVGAARTSELTRTITFAADTLTVMITVTPLAEGEIRIDGWASPGHLLPVELRTPEGSRHTAADDGGRFEFPSVPSGRVQLILHPEQIEGRGDARQVVTPAVEL